MTRTATATVVSVEGRLGGLMMVGSARGPLPAGTEARLAGFTELAATAIANAQARVELRGSAEEQAALRRVATLVAQGACPGEVFAAVTEEAGRLLRSEFTFLSRYDLDGARTVVASWSSTGGAFPVGARVRLGGGNVPTLVFQTGRAARVDDYAEASGRSAGGAPEAGGAGKGRGAAMGRHDCGIGGGAAAGRYRGAAGRVHRTGRHRDRQRRSPG